MALTQRRHDTGVASMVDVRSAETTYQQARADAAALVATIAQDLNALQLLVGSPVDESLLPAGLEEGAQWLAEVPAGISSDVLLQRPDVLAAEHTLQAANANIGAARAKLFPTLSLTASGGVASAALSSLFTGGATIWSLAPSLALPIFDGGANQANLAYTQAQKQGYIASYELTVQTAFQEVANALATRGTVQEQLSALDALVNAAADSYRLAEARYTRGADTFLNALDAQRTLYSAQSSRVATQLAELDSRVALYRYLGGGLAGEATASPVAQGE
jgi:multidrug efflux system outer membrane protein